MRLFAVADLHYSLPQFDWVLDIAPDFDVVVMAGDHPRPRLDRRWARAEPSWCANISSRLRAETELVICSGNHDLDVTQRRRREGRQMARGCPSRRESRRTESSIQLDGTLFTVCPWWDGPIVKAGIATQLAERRDQAGQAVDLDPSRAARQVAHQLGRRQIFWRCRAEEWIEQYRPDMVLSGHVHQSPFVKDGSWVDRIGPTWVFNTGQQFGAPPAHIIIDTDAGEALWFSSAGNQYVRLDRAARAAGAEAASAAGLAQSRGSASRSGPGVKSSCCWWISVSSTSPTMPR